MTQVIIVRGLSTNEGTPGTFAFGDRKLACMELPWRGNAPKFSCIPAGTYTCLWARSPKFGFCYHLQDVPRRSAILIHSGNFAGDTRVGWQTDVLGCILPAMSITKLKNSVGLSQVAGIDSRRALKLFEEWADSRLLALTISDEFVRTD